MAELTLTEIKDHLRIEQASTDQDALLTAYNEAAQDYAAQFLNRPIPWTDENDDPVPVPSSIKAAMLLIIGDLYENREAQIVGTVINKNMAAENMLHFYRIGLGI